MHVLRNARRGVKCNGRPHVVDVLLRDAMGGARKGGAPAFAPSNFQKRSVGLLVSGYETKVVEHRAGVKKFGIET